MRKNVSSSSKYVHAILILVFVVTALIGSAAVQIPGRCSIHFLGWLRMSYVALLGALLLEAQLLARDFQHERKLAFAGLIIWLCIVITASTVTHTNRFQKIFLPLTIKLGYIPWHQEQPALFGSVWKCESKSGDLILSDIELKATDENLFLTHGKETVPIDSCVCLFASELTQQTKASN